SQICPSRQTPGSTLEAKKYFRRGDSRRGKLRVDECPVLTKKAQHDPPPHPSRKHYRRAPRHGEFSCARDSRRWGQSSLQWPGAFGSSSASNKRRRFSRGSEVVRPL